MKSIYLAGGYEDCEGRGPPKMFAAFESKSDAVKAAKDRYESYAATPVEVTVFKSLAEFRRHDDQEARKKALAKLTPAERRLLGLPEPD